MRVIRAKVLGFCMGVRRAVEIAEACLAREPSVFTLGPLIHNPQALASLESRGTKILDKNNLPASLDGAVVVIRAHGVSPDVEEELRRRGGRVVDATCRKVKASQQEARALAGKGFTVFIAGEKNHAEILGLSGYAGPSAVLVENAEEAARKARELASAAASAPGSGASCALIGQTTISAGEYAAIADSIRAYFPNLEVKQTICGATADRQNSLRELCKSCRAIIVAGSRDSANTRRLLSIARQALGGGGQAWLVESEADIPADELRKEAGEGRIDAVGLCAGASTPKELIDAIEQKLAAL